MEVSQAEQARIGDLFDFHYTIKGFGKQGQIDSLVHKLDQDPRWEVKEFDFDGKNKVRLRVKILENPFPVVIVVGVIGAIGAGLFCFLSLDKIEKIIATPVGAAVGLGTIALGAITLWKFYK
ncbi:hypothetical protein ES702_06360 [subsurface metagenome]